MGRSLFSLVSWGTGGVTSPGGSSEKEGEQNITRLIFLHTAVAVNFLPTMRTLAAILLGWYAHALFLAFSELPTKYHSAESSTQMGKKSTLGPGRVKTTNTYAGLGPPIFLRGLGGAVAGCSFSGQHPAFLPLLALTFLCSL